MAEQVEQMPGLHVTPESGVVPAAPRSTEEACKQIKKMKMKIGLVTFAFFSLKFFLGTAIYKSAIIDFRTPLSSNNTPSVAIPLPTCFLCKLI